MNASNFIVYTKVNYKYKLAKDYIHKLSFTIDKDIKTPFIELYKDGTLIVKAFYAWDGCSGIAVDDDTNMRGGLVHDALYQLMREGYLSVSIRILADKELKDICIADDMNRIRASLYFDAVELFGEQYAGKQEEKIYTAPKQKKYQFVEGDLCLT